MDVKTTELGLEAETQDLERLGEASPAPGTPTRSGASAPESPPPLGAERAGVGVRAAFPVCARDANGRFLPGAPGRMPGQRNLISGRVARSILRDFEVDEAELLPRLKRWFLPQYIQLVAKLLPKNGTEGVGEAEDVDAALRPLGHAARDTSPVVCAAREARDLDAAARVAALRAALAVAEAELGAEDR